MDHRGRVRQSPKSERRTAPRTKARVAASDFDVREIEPTERARLTIQLPRALIERLRNAVYWTPGLNETALFADCITSVVERLETERGQVFPQRERSDRAGSPKRGID